MTLYLGVIPDDPPDEQPDVDEPPAPDPAGPLADALTRFMRTTGAPAYLVAPATAWLAARPTPST